jgi:hypothetical protein
MNIYRERRKKRKCFNHRVQQYLKALDGVINGTIPPEYATLRFKKLKDLS